MSSYEIGLDKELGNYNNYVIVLSYISSKLCIREVLHGRAFMFMQCIIELFKVKAIPNDFF